MAPAPAQGSDRSYHADLVGFVLHTTQAPLLLLLLLLRHISRVQLCVPIDGSPPDSIPGIVQARTLAWVAISFSSA